MLVTSTTETYFWLQSYQNKVIHTIKFVIIYPVAEEFLNQCCINNQLWVPSPVVQLVVSPTGESGVAVLSQPWPSKLWDECFYQINSLHFWVIFHAFVVVCWLFKKFFQEHYQSVKWFESRSGPTFCRSWSGYKLFTKLISRRQKLPLKRR